MKKTLKLFLLAIAISEIFVGCGKDEPGPKGDAGKDALVKRGYFEGVVSGVRKDGTSFSEIFKYENLNDTLEGYSELGDAKLITLQRSMEKWTNLYEGRNLSLFLKSKQEGIFEPQSVSSVFFNFVKEQDQNNLFKLNALAYFEETGAFVRLISSSEDEAYNFYGNNYQTLNYYLENIVVNSISQSVYRFYSYNQNVNYYLYYSSNTGSLVAVEFYEKNLLTIHTTGTIFDLYNKLKFKQNQELGYPVFYKADTDAPLFEKIPDVPADKLLITNYNRDATTGIVTFDYEIQISKYITSYYRVNSTGHDLTIKGKFNSGHPVYKSISGRLPG